MPLGRKQKHAEFETAARADGRPDKHQMKVPTERKRRRDVVTHGDGRMQRQNVSTIQNTHDSKTGSASGQEEGEEEEEKRMPEQPLLETDRMWAQYECVRVYIVK